MSEVHEIEVEGRIKALLQSLDAIPGFLHRVTGEFKNADAIYAHCGRIVDNQCAFHLVSRPF
jgi:hypothetical protein